MIMIGPGVNHPAANPSRKVGSSLLKNCSRRLYTMVRAIPPNSNIRILSIFFNDLVYVRRARITPTASMLTRWIWAATTL